MTEKFKEGDLVKLKSGGAVMTVRDSERITDNELKPLFVNVECDWHSTDGAQQYGRYRQDQLELMEEEGTPESIKRNADILSRLP